MENEVINFDIMYNNHLILQEMASSAGKFCKKANRKSPGKEVL